MTIFGSFIDTHPGIVRPDEGTPVSKSAIKEKLKKDFRVTRVATASHGVFDRSLVRCLLPPSMGDGTVEEAVETTLQPTQVRFPDPSSLICVAVWDSGAAQ